MANRLRQLQNDVVEWADATFGYNRLPDVTIAHLVSEIKELKKSPYDYEEYADCFMLLIQAFHQAGGNTDMLLGECFKKLEINKKRRWGKKNIDGYHEHIEDK